MNLENLSTLDWQREPPANAKAIEELLSQSQLELPEDYLAFLRWSNGGGGNSKVNADCYSLWPTSEVVQLNRDYEIDKWLPDFFAIGSDGGGESLVFNTRTWKLYKVQLVCLVEDEALFFAESFAAFILNLCAPAMQPRPFGLAQGEFFVPDNFDAPLPEDILDLLEGR